MTLKKTLILAPTLLSLVLNLTSAGCSSSDGGKPDPVAFQSALQDYDAATEELVSQLVAVVEAAQGLDAGLIMDDTVLIDAAADQLETSTDELLTTTVALEELESRLKGGAEQKGMITQKLVLVVSVGLLIAGTWAFGKKMKDLSNEMSSARKERDAAADGVMNNEPGAEDKYSQAKAKMTDVGGRAIKEVTTKVVTEMVLSPINPTSVSGLLLKDKLGNELGEGIKVLTASPGCESEGGAEPCTLTVQRTDGNSRVTIPSGKQTVLISKAGKARVAVKEISAEPGVDHELKRELIDIDKADPDKVAANDEGTYEPGEDPGDEPDGGGSTGGTVSGTFPGEPFNGLQLSYSISGVSADAPTDVEGFTWARSYEGTLGGGTLTVSGTARAENGYSATLNVTATAGSNSDSDEGYMEIPSGGGLVTHDFSVSVPIPEGATAGSVTINLVGEYNAGSRAVVVSVTCGDAW